MNVYIELLCLWVTIVFIVDLSGFTDSWRGMLSAWLNKRVVSFRPFDCSLCLTWWAGLLWLLVRHSFTLAGVAYVAVLAFMSHPLSQLLCVVYDAIVNLISKISNRL